MRTIKNGAVLAGVVSLAALAAVPALAHQTVTSRGVAVTLHVTPDDEPVAGRPSAVSLVKVKPRSGSFSHKSCGCRIRVTDSSGRVIASRAFTKRTTVTFPRPVAYRIAISGSYKRGGKKRPFSATFAVRAS